MTDKERAEFERQKQNAVNQIKTIYRPPKSVEPILAQTEDLKKVKPKETFGLELLRNFNFKNIKIDNDRLIIIALLLLLATENTNELLILALVYILL